MSSTTERSSVSVSSSGSAAASGAHGYEWWMLFVLIAGVALPSAAVGFEIFTRLCSFIFDPFPTTWHLALLALVPLGNLLVLWTYRRADARTAAPAAFLVGLSAGVAFAYSVVFLPILPFCVIGIICYGIGLLGLAPFFALASSLICGARLGRSSVAARNGRALIWAGVAAGLAPIVIYALASHMTLVGLRMAASGNETRSQHGIDIIRRYGSKQALLRACYELPIDPWVWTAIGQYDPEDRVPRQQARDIYYRVTGEPFNSVPPPQLAGPRTRAVEDAQYDADVGGTAVNGIARDVSLASSTMHSTIDGDGLVAYTEWAMEFRNSASNQREARAEIALPPGGAVTRLTLWVNGEEREAAFGGREAVRQAYQRIAVVERRDPVLVTTCGPDRVLMQCFPVPPRGGKMKVRMGITSPLLPSSARQALFVPPHFVERNFAIPDQTKHDLNARSSSALTPAGSANATTEIRKQLDDSAIADARTSLVRVEIHDGGQVWTPDPISPSRYAIIETLTSPDAPSPQSVFVVLDSSLKMRGAREDIAAALVKLPRRCRFSVIRAGEETVELVSLRPATSDNLEQAARMIADMDCHGGIDNRRALLKACDSAGNQPNGVILWIHGPQPFQSDARTQQLRKLCRSHPDSPSIYALAASDGRNSVLADLEKTGAIVKVPRLSSLANDLDSLFGAWSGAAKRLVAVRKRVPIGSAVGERVSAHVAKLWTMDEVCRLCREGRMVEAVVLAARCRLVTPVTGAVVLEKDEQYEANGLNPPKVAVTPEPSTWLTLAVGAALVGFRYRRRADCKSGATRVRDSNTLDDYGQVV